MYTNIDFFFISEYILCKYSHIIDNILQYDIQFSWKNVYDDTYY